MQLSIIRDQQCHLVLIQPNRCIPAQRKNLSWNFFKDRHQDFLRVSETNFQGFERRMEMLQEKKNNEISKYMQKGNPTTKAFSLRPMQTCPCTYSLTPIMSSDQRQNMTYPMTLIESILYQLIETDSCQERSLCSRYLKLFAKDDYTLICYKSHLDLLVAGSIDNFCNMSCQCQLQSRGQDDYKMTTVILAEAGLKKKLQLQQKQGGL